MKNIFLKRILLFAVMATVSTSCNDLLDVESDTSITKDNFYTSESDFQAATAPLYNIVWFDFNNNFYFGMGDGRSYNLYAPFSDYIYPFTDLTENGLTGPLVSAWSSLYVVIQQSNNVIEGIKASSVNEESKAKYLAEARFMRGTAYWYLTSLWGDVIISENQGSLVNNPIVSKSPRTDVYEFAMRDLEYAAKYLPETAPQTGRLTKYSAFGMLSRVYLSYAGLSDNPESGTRSTEYLDLAKKAASKAINEGPYSLMTNYADLFEVDNNNNSESMFALQWVPNGTYGVTNFHQAYLALNSEVTGDDAAYGGYTRASVDILQEYESNDLRRKATWMADNDFYATINKANGGYTVDHANDFLTAKKGVVGSTKDNPKTSRQNSGLNTNMLRLAEVYLNYAEATLGNSASTTDATALEYVNTLRRRAGLGNLTSLTYEILRKERRIELCLEGQYWYDLVRRSYYKQQEVINYVTGQSRGLIPNILYNNETNTVTIDEDIAAAPRSVGVPSASMFLLPYPETEVIQNPLLKEAPVAFKFTEDRITDLFQ